MANWYEELLEIDKKHKIIAITVKQNAIYYARFLVYRKRDFAYENFDSLEAAKHIFDYDFDDENECFEGPYFTAWAEDYIFFEVRNEEGSYIHCVSRKQFSPFNGYYKNLLVWVDYRSE